MCYMENLYWSRAAYKCIRLEAAAPQHRPHMSRQSTVTSERGQCALVTGAGQGVLPAAPLAHVPRSAFPWFCVCCGRDPSTNTARRSLIPASLLFARNFGRTAEPCQFLFKNGLLPACFMQYCHCSGLFLGAVIRRCTGSVLCGRPVTPRNSAHMDCMLAARSGQQHRK